MPWKGTNGWLRTKNWISFLYYRIRTPHSFTRFQLQLNHFCYLLLLLIIVLHNRSKKWFLGKIQVKIFLKKIMIMINNRKKKTNQQHLKIIYVFLESGKLKKCKTICVFITKKNDLFSRTNLKKNDFLEKFKFKKKKQ